MSVDNVSIVYTGHARFASVTEHNHRQMIDRIRSVLPTEVYHMTTDQVDQSDNPWREVSGASQVWQFVNACAQVYESIVIKFRTDLWFTPMSMNVVQHELEEILLDRQDAAFLGSNWNEFLGHEHTRLRVKTLETVQDFVVMARRSSLRDPRDILDDLNHTLPGKLKCGTKVFDYVLDAQARAHNVMCQIWLCRQHYLSPNHYTVGKDYVLSYKKQWKMPHALTWIDSQQHRYS